LVDIGRRFGAAYTLHHKVWWIFSFSFHFFLFSNCVLLSLTINFYPSPSTYFNQLRFCPLASFLRLSDFIFSFRHFLMNFLVPLLPFHQLLFIF
jgi:hypothetical protein